MASDFAQRFKLALDARGWSQGKLAQRLGVTQSAVSQIASGRKQPRSETLQKISALLNVSSGWLLAGEGGEVQPPSLRNSPDEVSWHRRQSYGDGTRQYGNMRAEVLQAGIPVLARETGQNSSDAAIGPDLQIEYRLGVISGARLERFKTALDWSTLERHYEAVALDLKHRTTRRYRDGLSLMQETGSIWLLRIDDYGTTGLVGDEFQAGCFSALVRRSQDSQKREGETGAGGRFGLGSGIVSALSALDLVLFNSTLSRPADGKTEGRLIGRAFFPFHTLGDTEYEGPFFFGTKDPESEVRRLSAWAAPGFLDDLWLKRNSNATGTSILLVGFFDPSQGINKEASAEVALRSLSEEFIENFWPALTRGTLSAKFSRYENDRVIEERVIDSANLEHPCKSLLDGSADIVEAGVQLSIPKSRETKRGPYEHSAHLIISTLSTEATGSAHLNEVALCRKPMMVVKYVGFPGLVLGAIPFRAVLLAGEAANEGDSSSVENEAAENFLSKAEPPQHDDWTSRGTDLVGEFRGGSIALKSFMDSLKAAVRVVVTPPNDQSSEAPPKLRELLALPSMGVPPSVRAFVSSIDWVDASQTKLRANVKLTSRSEDRFTLIPVLGVSAETGGNLEIQCRIESITNCEVTREGTIRAKPGAREMTLLIEPDWAGLPVRPDLSALEFGLSLSEKATI